MLHSMTKTKKEKKSLYFLGRSIGNYLLHFRDSFLSNNFFFFLFNRIAVGFYIPISAIHLTWMGIVSYFVLVFLLLGRWCSLTQSLSLWFVTWNLSGRKRLTREPRVVWGLEVCFYTAALGVAEKAKPNQAALRGAELPLEGIFNHSEASITLICNGHCSSGCWIS